MAEQKSQLPLPPNPPSFAETPDSLSRLAAYIQDEHNRIQQEIVDSVAPEDATFENTFLPIADLDNRLTAAFKLADLLVANSDIETLRAAGTQARQTLWSLFDDRFMRQDVFKRVDKVFLELEQSNLDTEDKKLVRKWHRWYTWGGCGLNDSDREKLSKISSALTDYQSRFRKTLVESKDFIWLDRQELSGLNASILDGFEKRVDPASGKDQFCAPLKTSVIKKILAQVEDGRVRKYAFERMFNSTPDNVDVFVEIMRLRQQRAQLLGFDSFASLRLSEKMARNPENMEEFLDNLRKELNTSALAELERLKKIKQAKVAGPSQDGALGGAGYYVWDQMYYHEQHLKQLHQVDNQRLAEYFPLDHALTSMLKIFEDVFNIQFVKIDEATKAKLAKNPADLTWHKDVKMFALWEREVRNEESFIGYLYADLTVRDGKYPNCANFNISPGFTDTDGRRSPVATALITTFTPPTPSKPTLLTHDNIVQMFHELGHGMHDLLCRTRYAALHGHALVADFVEMPSQMLENWCWMPDQLSSMSRHYTYLDPAYAEAWKKETGEQQLPPERLPEEIATKLAASRCVDIALSTLRQIHFAKFDLYCHGKQEITAADFKRNFNETREQIGLISTTDGTGSDLGHEFATMIHFVDGSATNYYSYLLTQVYSSDIFQTAFQKNPRDSVIGTRYRQLILEPGDSQEPMDMLRNFLGREPQRDAFYRNIGLA
ncbi:hypothetical protein BX600DRAFT_499997 [Xylariales sp. PMI_506]|nr:hypothetical protein BX600DRAFT_499997 [Xylariales sp. PMI_506]